MDRSLAADGLLALTAVIYAGSAALYFRHLAGNPAAKGAKSLLAVGAALHCAHLLTVAFVSHACPVAGVHHAISLMALSVALLFLAACSRFRLDVAGAFVVPVVLAAFLASRLAGTASPARVRNLVLPFHVTSVLLACAFFSVSFGLSATYLLSERSLKRKRGLGKGSRFPSLEALERASHRFLLAGFPLLTLGILTGLLWFGKIKIDPTALLRHILSYAAWISFAIVLLMRGSGRFRGRSAAWVTVIGFSCAVLVFLGYLLRSRVG